MFLSKKKKSELVQLCDHLDLKTDGLKKPELEALLTTHLFENQDTLWEDPMFAGYYETLASRSPQKLRESPRLINPVDPIIPAGTTRARRRTSRYVPGTSSVEPEAHIPRSRGTASVAASDRATPQPATTEITVPNPLSLMGVAGASQTTTLAIPVIPASPEAVTAYIDETSQALSTRVISPVQERILQPTRQNLEQLRTSMSNTPTVALLVETYSLLNLVLKLVPFTYPLPALAGHTFHLPDLFVIFEGAFWVPIIIWLFTSVLVPASVGWLVNFTRGRSKVDPVVYAVAKAVVAWAVWVRGIGVTSSGMLTVENAVGKDFLVGVGAGIIGVVGAWDGLVGERQ